MDVLKIGFIGLGQMGKPMAKNLLKKQFQLTTCGHQRKESVNEIELLGGKIVSSPEEVAKECNVIIIMVRDTQQADEVVYGKGFWEGKGIWQKIKSGSIIIICSTVSPTFCQKLATTAEKIGISVLDAPVSGGHPRAEAGALTFMIGGDRGVYERCRPVFEAMGQDLFYVGGYGMGQALKLINNYMMIVNAFGTSEGIAMGLKFGLDLRQMLEIIKRSSGNSSVVQNWDMLTLNKQEFERSGVSAESIFDKDMALAVNFAREIGASVDLGSLVLKLGDSRLFPTVDPG